MAKIIRNRQKSRVALDSSSLGITLDRVRLGTNLKQTVDESDLADNIYLITEEGYLMNEQINSPKLMIQED